MSESSEIIRNEFPMCQNHFGVLKCLTCPGKVIEKDCFCSYRSLYSVVWFL